MIGGVARGGPTGRCLTRDRWPRRGPDARAIAVTRQYDHAMSSRELAPVDVVAESPRTTSTWVRALAMTGFAVVLGVWCAAVGVPNDTIQVFL